MRETLADSANLTRKALYGIDDGWYDTHWYGERRHALPRLPSRMVNLLRGMFSIARGGHTSASPTEGLRVVQSTIGLESRPDALSLRLNNAIIRPTSSDTLTA